MKTESSRSRNWRSRRTFSSNATKVSNSPDMYRDKTSFRFSAFLESGLVLTDIAELVEVAGFGALVGASWAKGRDANPKQKNKLLNKIFALKIS